MVPFQINLQASIDLDTIFIYTRSWPPSITTYNDPPKKNRNTGPQHKEIVHSTRVSGVRDTLWSNVAIKHHWWRHVPLKPSKTSIYVGKTCIYVGRKLHLCGKTYISVGFAWLHVWLPDISNSTTYFIVEKVQSESRIRVNHDLLFVWRLLCQFIYIYYKCILRRCLCVYRSMT